MSLRDLRDVINRRLPADQRVSLGTVANYERPPEPGKRSAGPRAGFVTALKRAYPELRLEWLLLGEGEPTEVAERVAAARGLDAAGTDTLTGRVLARHPDLELLSPEASTLFTGVLARYAMGEPGMKLGEEQLVELAADLRWLLFLPLSQWGFVRQPDYDRFGAYCVGLLHALSLALPAPGDGDPIATYPHSLIRRLRETVAVGLGGD